MVATTAAAFSTTNAVAVAATDAATTAVVVAVAASLSTYGRSLLHFLACFATSNIYYFDLIYFLSTFFSLFHFKSPTQSHFDPVRGLI